MISAASQSKPVVHRNDLIVIRFRVKKKPSVLNLSRSSELWPASLLDNVFTLPRLLHTHIHTYIQDEPRALSISQLLIQ